MTVAFTAYGTPVPQGSARAYGNRVVASNHTRLRPWRENVAAEARIAWDGQPLILGPVAVKAEFYFRRPKSHYRAGKNAHLLRDNAPAYPHSRSTGDLDKLARSLGDSLTETVLADDSQIVRWRLEALWCEPDQAPGVEVLVTAL